MKVTVIPIVTGALSIFAKGLVQGQEDLEIRGQVETIQTTAFLRSARILRRVLETCCLSSSSEKPSSKADVKNSQESKIRDKYLDLAKELWGSYGPWKWR